MISRAEQLNIDDINHLTDQQQAEIIADKFASVQNEYEALQTEDIDIPPFSKSDIPKFHPSQVWFILSRLDTSKATVPGDFPPQLMKHFAAYLADPLTDIFNTGMRRGEYPKLSQPQCPRPTLRRVSHSYATLVVCLCLIVYMRSYWLS